MELAAEHSDEPGGPACPLQLPSLDNQPLPFTAPARLGKMAIRATSLSITFSIGPKAPKTHQKKGGGEGMES